LCLINRLLVSYQFSEKKVLRLRATVDFREWCHFCGRRQNTRQNVHFTQIDRSPSSDEITQRILAPENHANMHNPIIKRYTTGGRFINFGGRFL